MPVQPLLLLLLLLMVVWLFSLGRLQVGGATQEPHRLLEVVDDVVVVDLLTSDNGLLAAGLLQRRGLVPVGSLIVSGSERRNMILSLFHPKWPAKHPFSRNIRNVSPPRGTY